MLLPWQFNLLLAFLFALLLLSSGFVYERIGEARDLRREPPPGRMVRVGRCCLHLLVKGEGPTVVIEQGAGGLSRYWWELQDQIAEFAQVCSYDRAGYGWSQEVGGRRSIEQRAEELHALLQNAGIAAPYLFVAHSYGGLIVRAYAQRHRSEIAGLILVDTPEESSLFKRDVLSFYAKVSWINRVFALFASFGILRALSHWVALDRYGIWLKRPSEFRAVCDDLDSLQRCPETDRSSRNAGSLGALPMTVISHGQPFPGPFAVLETNWAEGQRRLAALSSNSRLIVSHKSNHMIHDDDPEVILASIRNMLQCFQAGTALTGPASP